MEVTAHQETENIAKAALETIPAAIVNANDPSVDIISGATLSSGRIMKAVVLCLEQAAK